MFEIETERLLFRNIFAVQSAEELTAYQSYLQIIRPKLEKYLSHLKDTYSVHSLPRSVVWTNAETATHLISDIPVPAYTNEYRTVFCPDPDTWRGIYLRQLDEVPNDEVCRYYENRLSENHILQILGHEFVHHSDLFPDGFDTEYDSGIWFEEGMCEYISRKFFLTDKEFEDEAHINTLLVEMFRERYGNHSLEDFGAATYAGDYASIFYEYWRSFLAVKEIVERFDGDVPAVFREYQRWYQNHDEKTLSEWFDVSV